MLNEQVLDALRSINVPEDKALAAAISLTDHEPRTQALVVKITVLDGKVTLLQWMVVVNTALLVALIVKLFHVG